MNYPVWYLPDTGGGLLIALIAVLHVFVSHFAVGGGLYLIYAEKKARAENSQGIMEFTRRHARFFLLITMVFGSITGVGIWFIISLVNPAATSMLIHLFVFGWAAEWVFFVVEIAAAFVYFYMFDRMDARSHLQVGWLYFIAAWMSLFLINGIIGFMLTPGGWLQEKNFWIAFFNPSFFPALFFRTFVSTALAGIYGFLTASFTRDTAVRQAMTRFSGKWALLSLLAAIPSGYWYISVLPEQAARLVLGKSPTIAFFTQYGLGALLLLLVLALLLGFLRPQLNQKPMAVLAMLAALISMGAFEWIREAARRPYVINELIYSNSIFKTDVDKINSQGFLARALWSKEKAVSAENRLAAGKELFIHQCYSCHTLDGGNNALKSLTSRMSYPALVSYIKKIHQVRYFMPPFAGSESEVKALAAYIAAELHGKEAVDPPPAVGGIRASALFDTHCASCHVFDDLRGAFAGKQPGEAEQMLAALNEISSEMEPFSGSPAERAVLAGYLISGLDVEQAAPAGAATGSQLFDSHCASCHVLADLQSALAGKPPAELISMLGRLNEISEEMEPFAGTAAEAEVLAATLASQEGGAK